MTTNNEDQFFWDLVEQFIQQANDACDDKDPGVVSAALLNAAARFNAFVVASTSLDKKEFAADVDETLNYLSGRYRDFLREHLEDYNENYTDYIGVRDLPDE
jgi:hypothetical protein